MPRRLGLLANIGLVLLKLVTGLAGNHMRVADAIESSTDVVSSLIVWRGLQITGKPPDDEYRYGYGKAESIATAFIALMFIGSAICIVIMAIREIITPHASPSPGTLVVLGAVILVKEFLFRRVLAVGEAMPAPPSSPMPGIIATTAHLRGRVHRHYDCRVGRTRLGSGRRLGGDGGGAD